MCTNCNCGPSLKMSKELFCSILNNMEQQFKFDSECHDAFGIILKNDFISGYDYTLVLNSLLSILKRVMNDDTKESWIEYFIYELDFGKKYTEGSVTENILGIEKNINLSTSENLYDFLIKNNIH